MNNGNTIRILPPSFFVERYGVQCRLVEESDAEFIVSLRNDARLNRFIHKSGDVESQVKWIREYKKRESSGVEYYFIFLKDGSPYGLSRIYHIDWARHTYTGGSWLCLPDIPIEQTFLTTVIVDEIRESLGLLVNIYDVRKNNSKVLNFHRKILCAYEYGETNEDVLFLSTPETRKKSRLRKLMGVPPIDAVEPVPTLERKFDY